MKTTLQKSAKELLRHLRKRGAPPAAPWISQGDANAGEDLARAILRCDRKRLTDLQAPPLAHAELAAIEGRLKEARELLQKQKQLTPQNPRAREFTEVLDAWLARRLAQPLPGAVPDWVQDLEEGINLINKGLPLHALPRLQQVLSHSESLSWVHWDRALSGWTFCLMHLGLFREARHCADWQLNIFARYDCPIMHSACLRRRATIALFERDLTVAQEYLLLVELHPFASHRSRLLAMHLRLTIALEQGHGYSAQGVLESVRSLRGTLQLKPEELQPSELEALHDFSSGKFKSALLRAERWSQESQAIGDRVGEVQALVLWGLTSAIERGFDIPPALARLDSALDLARQEGLLALRLMALARATAAAAILTDAQRLELWLSEGEKLAKSIGAQRWMELFSHLYGLTSPQSRLADRMEAWLRLVAGNVGFAREIRLIEEAMEFHPRGWSQSSEAGPVHWPPQLVIFVPECHLAASRTERRDSQIKVKHFDPDSPGGKSALAFLELKKGQSLPLESIHKLFSRVAFRMERHEGRVRGVVTQARRLLGPLGISIHWNRETRQFERTGKAVITLSVAASQPRKPGRPSHRSALAEELLAFLGDREFVATTEMSQHFQMTRQGLHPVITKLVEDGLVRRVRCGRNSGIAPSLPTGRKGVRR